MALSADDRMPGHRKPAFDCPNCGAFAGQTWFPLGRDDEDKWDQNGFTFDSDDLMSTPAREQPKSVADVVENFVAATTDRRWWQAQCSSCACFSTWRGQRLVYPAVGSAPPPNPEMPEVVTELYNEARAVVGVSRRAGAALARATLERLLREVLPEAAPKTKLFGLIGLTTPKVSAGLVTLLTYIRHVGNETLHAEDEQDEAVVLVLDESTTEAVDVIFTAINDVVDELIVKPRQVAKFEGLIPARVKAEVARQQARQQGS